MKQLPFLAALWALWLCATGALAGTQTAASAELAAVTTAYNAASAGDTVYIPADTATWDGTLTIAKAICIIGADTSKTMIVYGTGIAADCLMLITPASDLKIEVSKITFDLVTQAASQQCGVEINGSTTGAYNLSKIRIFNNKFIKGKYSIHVVGWVTGVIHGNLFLNPNYCIQVQGFLAASWAMPITTGTSNAVFIEDNLIVYNNDGNLASPGQAISHFNGARSVIRYNTVDGDANTNGNTSFIDIHGNQGQTCDPDDARGEPIIEIYNNTFSANASDGAQLWFQRGGSVVAHDNSFAVATGAPLVPYLYIEQIYSCPASLSGHHHDYCRTADGTATGTGLWPAMDQITNTFMWNNTANWNSRTCHGGVIDSVWLSDGNGDQIGMIKRGRDYHFRAPSADGTNCTYTDPDHAGQSTTYPSDGTLAPTVPIGLATLVCDSSGADAYYPYVPYTYPHPLRGPRYKHQSNTHVILDTLYGASGNSVSVICSISVWKSKVYLGVSATPDGVYAKIDSMAGVAGTKDTLTSNVGTTYLETWGLTYK
jgi:hypothetical protein